MADNSDQQDEPPTPKGPAFWEKVSLSEMTTEQWESLCDGCGRCCLVLLLDEDQPADVYETSACCALFDPKRRRCLDYANRSEIVPECVVLTPENAGTLSWMPESCAYRRLAEGRGLADWHPLITGTRASVVDAGIAVGPDLISVDRINPARLQDYITKRRS